MIPITLVGPLMIKTKKRRKKEKYSAYTIYLHAKGTTV